MSTLLEPKVVDSVPPKDSFRLLRYFVLVSVGAVVAITALSGLGLHFVLRDEVIKYAEDDAVHMTDALRGCELQEFVSSATNGQLGLAISSTEIPQLDRNLRAFLAPFDIVKIKVFDLETRIIYSTDRKIIGELVPDNPRLAAALSGKVVSEFGEKDRVLDLRAEERLDVDVVETYVPVRDEDGRIIGAFEIYKDVTPYFQATEATLFRSASIMLVVLLVVFAALSGLMHRAARLIKQSRAELVSLNEELADSVSDLRLAKTCADAANRAKSDFLANMSHEIRTPMTAILGFAENLLEGDQSESEKLSTIHTIRRNGKNLLGIINDILDLSKIEAGKMTTEAAKVHPCRVVAEVASLMRVRTDEKGLQLNIEYVGVIPETILSDPTRLRQILINLIGNAIKFTDVGAVRLVTRLVDSGHAQCLQFDVIDTGRGMTQEQATKLFQPFTQADASTKRMFGGTGLGLAISKRFAELLGGDIALVATEIGVGTTFRATVATGSLDGVRMLEDAMSATLVDDTAGTAAQAAPSDLRGLRILLAEDGPDNQRLISFLLKKAGADVTVEVNGKLAAEAALKACARVSPFDVILMDMQMPVMDGYEATGLLRRMGYAGPIIALTAHAMDGDREKCLSAGCDDYVSKPIDRVKLIETVRRFQTAGDELVAQSGAAESHAEVK